MIHVVLKTFIIYIVLLFAMRLLGKRQLGELEVSELITTFLLSEIATLPITNKDVPIYFALFPLLTIVIIDIAFSYVCCRFPKVRHILSSPPSTLIKNGKINQTELRKNRIATEELLSELRLQGVYNLDDVKYAILEQNGLMSVIPKAKKQQPTLEDMKIATEERGIIHVLISQGEWNYRNIEQLGLKKSQLEKYLRKRKASHKDVFLLCTDDMGNYTLILKGER